MANFPEELQKHIEPIIKDFIDSMELEIPHYVVTSKKKERELFSHSQGEERAQL